MKILVFLITLLMSFNVHPAEGQNPGPMPLEFHKNDLLEVRHDLERMLLDESDPVERQHIEKQWGDIMWLIMLRTDLETPETKLYVVQDGDTLGKIANREGTTIELIMKRNNLSTHKIRVGQKLSLWVKPLVLQVSKKDNDLKVYLDEHVIKKYKVSTGKSNTTTPEGEFVIKDRYPNPTWFHHGEIVPPGSPKNFLGTRWLGFDIQKYGIHGTVHPELIGQSVSGGCVRMKNSDVEELYDFIPRGTKVVIR